MKKRIGFCAPNKINMTEVIFKGNEEDKKKFDNLRSDLVHGIKEFLTDEDLAAVSGFCEIRNFGPPRLNR
jgi:hypothetical protein